MVSGYQSCGILGELGELGEQEGAIGPIIGVPFANRAITVWAADACPTLETVQASLAVYFEVLEVRQVAERASACSSHK